jgi:hypothetical protein
MSKVTVYPFDIRIEVIDEGLRSRRFGVPDAINRVGGVTVTHEPLLIDDSLLGKEVPGMTDLDFQAPDTAYGYSKGLS